MFDTMNEIYELEDAAIGATRRAATRRAATVTDRLEGLPAGPQLGRVLACLDLDSLSGRERIAVMRAQQRMASHHQAGVYAAMASVVDHMMQHDEDAASATEAAAAEIGVALRLTRRATENEVSLALDLHQRLPRVRAALVSGAIDRRRAWAMVQATGHLSTGGAQTVIERILPQAPLLTTGQLFARIRRLCVEANPEEAKDRYRHAVADRRVVAEPTTDGTMNLLGLDLPPNLTARAMSRINALARASRAGAEKRTMDQIRADVLLDLLLGETDVNGAGSVINIHVDIETLAGLAERPGDLGGYGPVVADIARQVADDSHDAEWRFTITDPDSDMPIGNGVTRRRPTTKQRREVEAKHRSCVFPGCRMPAAKSDVDHRVRHTDGGPTVVGNLGPLCRFHHRIKDGHGWTYVPTANGDFLWRTKLGMTHTTSGAPP